MPGVNAQLVRALQIWLVLDILSMHSSQVENQIHATMHERCNPTERTKATLKVVNTVTTTIRSVVIVICCGCAASNIGNIIEDKPVDASFLICIVALTLIGLTVLL